MGQCFYSELEYRTFTGPYIYLAGPYEKKPIDSYGKHLQLHTKMETAVSYIYGKLYTHYKYGTGFHSLNGIKMKHLCATLLAQYAFKPTCNIIASHSTY